MFEIPRITKPLELKDYAEELEGMVIQVWVNQPQERLSLFDELDRDEKGLEDVCAWLAESWEWFDNDGDERKSVNAKDVSAFQEECSETDPALFTFVTVRTIEMIGEHRRFERKN